MIQKIKKITICEWILCGVLGLELLYLFYCNLVHIPDTIEPDIAKMLYHTMEMARQSRIVLPDWLYTTTAEWDTVALPATVFFKITGNVCLSFGIVNMIDIVFFLFVVNRLLWQAGMSLRFRLTALALLFGLYDMDEVWYTADMLFTGGAQYYYKVLIPLLFLTVLTMPEEERGKWYNIVLLILCGLLSLVTAMSSGVYVFLCGVLPVIVCYAVFRRRDRYQWGTIAGIVLLTAVGLRLCSTLGVSPGSSTEMDLRTLSEVTDAPFRTFSTLLQVWNLFPKYPTQVTSIVGIGTVAKFVLIGTLLPFGFSGLRYVLGIRALQKDMGEADWTQIIRACLITIFAWNYFILYLTFATARYQLIGAIPLMLCAVFVLRDVTEKRFQTWVSDGLMIAVSALLMLIAVASVTYSEETHFHRRDALPAICSTVCNRMDELETKTVIWLNCREMAEVLRYYDRDTERLHTNMVVEENGRMHAFNWNTYNAANDRSGYNDRNVLIAPQADFERLPDHIRDAYTQQGDAIAIHVGNNVNDEFYIYVADVCPVDGASGLSGGETMIDLPATTDYTAAGQLNADGSLTTGENGIVYESVYLNPGGDNTVDLTLSYLMTTENVPGETRLEIIDEAGETLQTIPMQADEEILKFTIEGNRNHKLQVHHNGGSKLTIGKLEMTRR